MDPTSLLYTLFSEYGVFTIIAPFLLIFSLTYGLLRKTNLFGRDNPTKEKLYGIISFAISFYYIYKLSDVIFTQDFISFFFFEVLVLFFLLMVIALLVAMGKGLDIEVKDDEKSIFENYKKTGQNAFVGFLGLLVLFAFMYASSFSFTSFGNQSMGIISQIFTILIETGLLPIIIIIGILLGVISWVTRPPKKSNVGKKAKLWMFTPEATLEDIVKEFSKLNK
ncbi:hypothetical protein YN1_2660 [Nanoarchaeota archaeon]